MLRTLGYGEIHIYFFLIHHQNIKPRSVYAAVYMYAKCAYEKDKAKKDMGQCINFFSISCADLCRREMPQRFSMIYSVFSK